LLEEEEKSEREKGNFNGFRKRERENFKEEEEEAKKTPPQLSRSSSK